MVFHDILIYKHPLSAICIFLRSCTTLSHKPSSGAPTPPIRCIKTSAARRWGMGQLPSHIVINTSQPLRLQDFFKVLRLCSKRRSVESARLILPISPHDGFDNWSMECRETPRFAVRAGLCCCSRPRRWRRPQDQHVEQRLSRISCRPIRYANPHINVLLAKVVKVGSASDCEDSAEDCRSMQVRRFRSYYRQHDDTRNDP